MFERTVVSPKTGAWKEKMREMMKEMMKAFLSLGQLAGAVIIGVALWLRHDSQTSNLLILQFEGQQAPGTFYISEYTDQSPTVTPHFKRATSQRTSESQSECVDGAET